MTTRDIKYAGNTLKINKFERTSPNIAPRQWPTCKGPVGLAETNSTKYFFLIQLYLKPTPL